MTGEKIKDTLGEDTLTYDGIMFHRDPDGGDYWCWLTWDNTELPTTNFAHSFTDAYSQALYHKAQGILVSI